MLHWKRHKTNKMIAILAGAGILLCSIGQVAGLSGGEAYTASDLLLTQGQAQYDLCDGIKYNSGKYELSVWDDGGFDINTPGNYTVKYVLTPANPGPGAAKSLKPQGTAASQETAGASGAPTEQETAGAPGAPAEQETAGALESTVGQMPASGQDSAGAQTPASGQDSAGAQTPASGQDSAGAQTPALGQDSAGAQTPALGQDSAGAQTPALGQDSAGAQTPASGHTSAGAQTPTTGQTSAGVQTPASGHTSAGVQTPASGHTSAGTQESAGAQTSATGQASDGAQAPAAEQTSASEQASAGAQIPAAEQTSASNQASADAQIPAAEQTSNGAQTSATGHAPVGAQTPRGTQESSKTQGLPVVKEPLKTQSSSSAQETVGSQDIAAVQGNPESKSTFAVQKLSSSQDVSAFQGNFNSRNTVTARGSFDWKGTRAQGGSAASITRNERFLLKEAAPISRATASDAAIKTDIAPSVPTQAGPGAATSSPTKAGPGAATSSPTKAGPETVSSASAQAEPATATSSQADADDGEIYFTRTVIVKAAVQYQNLRFDVGTAANLLAGMVYDEAHYSLTVSDDGGFDGSRIGEYHVYYSLVNTDNGSYIADLDRYIWVTAPGVIFDSPDLLLRINQADYDLQEGISYDSGQYTLSAADPDSIDTSQVGEQRVMFTLTQRTDADEADEAQPVVAIFGRNVKVTDGPVVIINAPPLSIKAGSEAHHSLLEGADAEDEDGNPVKLQVADRSQLDRAANGQAPAVQGANGEASAVRTANGETAPDWTANGETAPDWTANGKATPAQAAQVFTATSRSAPEDAYPVLTLPPTAGANMLAARGPATASQASRQDENSPENSINPQIISQESSEAPRADAPSEKPESPSLPAALPPGTYQVLLSATHPVTGEMFTVSRLVRVSNDDLGIIRVTPPGSISMTNPVRDFSSITDALGYITSDGQKGKYTITLQQTYTWTDGTDVGTLEHFSANATEVVFSGLPVDTTGKLIPGAAKSTWQSPPWTRVYLPANSSTAFTVENIKIAQNPNKSSSLTYGIGARGSKLTMGEGIESSWPCSIYGKGFYEGLDGDVNLTIKSGSYFEVVGGVYGSASHDNGNIHVTVTGGHIGTLYGSIAAPHEQGDMDITMKGGTIDHLYGACNNKWTGNVSVTVDSGTVGSLMCNWGAPLIGQANVLIKGGTIGNVNGFDGSRQYDITPPDPSEKAVTTTVTGGSIYNLCGGKGKINGAGSLIELSGGTVSYLYGGDSLSNQPLSSPADIVITGSGAAVDSLSGFDSLTVADGQTFSPSRFLYANATRAGLGAVRLGAGSVLALPAAANTAGTLTATGAGSRLILGRTGSGSAPLTLYGSTAPDVTAGKITLSYPAGTEPVNGDKLIQMSSYPSLADAAPYISGFHDFSLLADKSAGCVYLGNRVSLQTGGGKPVFYSDLAAAMKAIGTGTDDYTIIIRKENYTVTDEDKAAIRSNGSHAHSITLSSGFTITDKDPLEPGEAVGDMKTRTVNISGDFGLVCPTYLDNIRLNLTSDSPSVYANGHPLYVGTRTSPYIKTGTVSMTGNYPDLYGGAETAQVDSARMVILSGQFHSLYGGGKGGNVTHDTSLVIGGDTRVSGSAYGGGDTGSVGGQAKMEVTGGIATAVNPRLIAGGRNGTVGSASLSISGGSAQGAQTRLLVSGAADGDVNGNVQINVTESDGPPPAAASADIYGAAGTGNIRGNVAITINNGKNYGIISGGSLGAGTVAGMRTVSFNSAQVKVDSIKDFDTLKLGPTAATTLTIGGSIYSNSGALEFYNGSFLNLPDHNTQRVGSIASYTAGTSHLYIGKASADGSTNPLHIAGANTSAIGNRLVLGLAHDAAGWEAKGDNLLVFDTPANANSAQYISDTTAYGIVVSADPMEPGTVEFGLTAFPQITEYTVRHMDGTGTLTQPDRGTTVTKTLHFTMTNYGADGHTYKGRPIDSAYIDTSYEADPAWEERGTMPTAPGVTPVTITRVPGSPDTSPVWDGTATLSVTPPVDLAQRCYYIHLRDTSGGSDTRSLDLESPVSAAGPTVSRDDSGDYTFKITFKDPSLSVPGTGGQSAYIASGLKQFAWSVGDANSSPGRSEALAAEMKNSDNLTVTTPPILDFAPYEWSFTIPAAKLGDNPSDKVVYLYAKDKRGNTRELAFPMNGNVIDVTVPLRVGLLALRGGERRLLAPACYVVNNSSTNSVKAEIVKAEMPPGELTFVSKGSGFTGSEMNLIITSAGGSFGNSFDDRSVVDISRTTPLNLGLMAPDTQADHGDYFTFDAQYDPMNIIKTGSWSLVKLSYRFTLEQNTAQP